jgi:alpha-aminoadipic semialdehyde synthase
MPLDFFKPGKTYLLFSHTTKGQKYNMPMLRKMMEQKINLIEYEKVCDDHHRRLIFFGRYAGIAGAIDSLWTYGQRLLTMGHSNPFDHLQQAKNYVDLQEANGALKVAANRLHEQGITAGFGPLIIGITGYGNVAKGAQEILQSFDPISLSHEDLLNENYINNLDPKQLYIVVFKEENLYQPIVETKKFELQHLYQNPVQYKSIFERFIKPIGILLNCMFWSPEYPRILTKYFLREHFYDTDFNLRVIGDITCDPNGSIESTEYASTIENPVYVFNPIQNKITDGFENEGIATMAIDILPSEIPKEASEGFSEALKPFIKDLAEVDFNTSFENLKLRPELKRALVIHNGQLCPDYKYMEHYL